MIEATMVGLGLNPQTTPVSSVLTYAKVIDDVDDDDSGVQGAESDWWQEG